eukprot:GHRR01037102.1.p1 GENE.GHRR01037102.1~~GHRR01037102.1.p1  ORF type:complete len:153 (-),score=14.89 GHRR01037102.1:5-463(-)
MLAYNNFALDSSCMPSKHSCIHDLQHENCPYPYLTSKYAVHTLMALKVSPAVWRPSQTTPPCPLCPQLPGMSHPHQTPQRRSHQLQCQQHNKSACVLTGANKGFRSAGRLENTLQLNARHKHVPQGQPAGLNFTDKGHGKVHKHCRKSNTPQ